MASPGKISKQQKVVKSKNPFYIFSGFLIIILPLIQFNQAQDAVLMPRLFAVCVFLLLFTLAAYSFKIKQSNDFSILKSPVFALLLLYLTVVIISTSNALNPKEGYFDIVRTFVFIVLVFYWVRLMLITPDWLEILPKFVIISALIASTIGFYQYFSLVFFSEVNRLPDGRELLYAVDGLMAHKNFYAGSLMLMLPLLIWGVWKLQEKWRIVAIVATVLVISLILIVATRAVWVAIIVSFIVTGVILVVYNRHFRISKKSIRNFAIIASVSILVVFTLIAVGGRISKNSYLQKLTSVVRPAEKNNHFRLDVWNITLNMAIENPMLGVGAGNWQIKAPEYYSKIKLKGKEVNWQTPHNDFLWILSEKGFPALLLFLGMLAFVLFCVLKIITGQAEKDKKIMTLLLFAGLLAYLGDSFFGFPYQRIDQQVYFALLIAGIVAIYHHQKTEKPLVVRPMVFGFAMTLFLLFGVFYSYASLQHEIHSKNAILLQKSGQHEQALVEINKAGTLFKSLDAIGSPIDYYAGLSYSAMNKHQEAISSFQKALTQHPNHIALLNNLGLSYYKTGNNELAAKYFNEALNIVPDYKEARVNLSNIYYSSKDYKKSLEMLEGVKKKKQIPEIQKNINALNKILGNPVDSITGDKKHKDKQPKKKKKDKNNTKVKQPKKNKANRL